jgi:DNA-binding transcriptional LysR family regulator
LVEYLTRKKISGPIFKECAHNLTDFVKNSKSGAGRPLVHSHCCVHVWRYLWKFAQRALVDSWDEIRTAYQVARMGTVSGAADVLGVHHATVIRHVDALEGRLGVKLFQRHARGYTPTEAGDDLFRVAQTTDDQLSQLAGRLKGQGSGVSGELVVTSLSNLSARIVPVLTAFQKQHPDLIVRYLTGARLFRLEYGEAHVAIRAGAAPEQLDNVVRPFVPEVFGLFAAKSYADKYGLPKNESELSGHRFISFDDIESRAPFMTWLTSHVDEANFVFRITDEVAMLQALYDGAGLGFAPISVARAKEDLIEVMEPLDEWAVSQWIVTHVDLHRTAKVQSFLTFLREAVKSWPQG